MASKSYQRYTFQHRVALNDVANQVDSFLKKLSSLRASRVRALSPSLIGFHVEYSGRRDDVPALRSFFKQLRPLMSRHFLRFVVEPLWTMESDNKDVFYMADQNPQDWCDAMWTISVVDDKHIDIGVTLPESTYHSDLLFDLSHYCKTHVVAPEGPLTKDRLSDLTTGFLRGFARAGELRDLHGDFHILLVPTPNHKYFTPVPLIGMTYFDARRRYGKVYQDTQYLLTQVCDATVDSDICGEQHAVHSLLMLMEEGEAAAKDMRRASAQATYGLAELLFGIYAKHHRDPDCRQDVMTFVIEDADIISPTILHHHMALTRA